MAFEVEELSFGGVFFKPKDYVEATALLIEPSAFQSQVPGRFGPKDQITADVTVFKDAAALSSGTPSEVLKGARISSSADGALTRDLKDRLGKAVIVYLDKVPSKQPGGNDAWVWRNVDGATKAAVVAYGQAREAALQAAMADAPSFDD